MALTAINDLFLEAYEGSGKGIDLGVRLTQQVQNEPQGGTSSYARQRCHLVHCLL